MESRRSLLDEDQTPTRDNVNVFDDEFEVEDADFVADGVRPAQNHDREASGRQDQDEEPVRSVAAHVASSSMSTTPAGPSRNSTRKSRGQQNPFASPEDEETEMPLMRTPSGNFEATRRSISSASSHQFARTSSLRFGQGPSHPYNMYPQGTMARTPSVTTTSTIRPQRQSSSRQPQHPYALYTQGVSDDLDDEHDTVANPVPVGFLGIGEHYQRRRGPDGEEQDLLGDFGHTEQLPPYTRYPEDGPEKVPLLDVPNPPTALHSRAPVLGTDPAMDLMHNQLRPVPTQQSMTDQSELNRAPSVNSRQSLVPSAHPSTQEDSIDTQKTWSEKSWREKRKTRVCGVPCWWFIALTGILVFVAAMLSGVIGGFVEGQKKGQAKALANASETPLYDASMIVTATTSPPPAMGTFALPLETPQATQAACLPDPKYQAAWGCDLVGHTNIEIVIETPGGSDQPGAYLAVDVEDELLPAYGTWRSAMSTLFSPFLLVRDNDAPENGPAYYFQAQYNKLVLVPENAFDPNAGVIKRGYPPVPTGWFNQKKYAGPEDRPWLCYWNNTFVEGFIYPQKIAIAATPSSTSYPTPPPTTYTTPFTVIGAEPTETITTTLTMPTTTCTYTGAASDFPNWMSSEYSGWYKSDGTVWPPQPTGDSTRKRDARDDHYERPEGIDKPYEADDHGQYPYLVKIEERRLPNSPHPYCNQIQILDNYSWNPVAGPDGAPYNTIYLQEKDPGYHAYVDNGGDGDDREYDKARLRKRRVVPGECHCQWQSGQK